MTRFAVRLVPAVVLILVATPLFAQRQQGGRGFGGGGGLGMLLVNKSVLEELKATDEQKEKLANVGKDMREKFGKDLQAAMKDMNREKAEQLRKEMNTETSKAVDKVLKAEQVKRLHQIELQVALQTGNLEALTQERVKKALNLTDKQSAAIKETSETLAKERREAFSGGQFDREKMQAITKKAQESGEKLIGTLSDDQKKAWKDLTGEKFNYVPGGPRRPQ
jgi:hypothetical protein